MKASHLLPVFILAASTALTGCVVRGSAGATVQPAAVVVVEEDPPPPRVEYYQARPGYIWITGRWHRDGNHWGWRAGHAERQRVGYVYAPGQWQRRGHGHVWVDGRWNARGNRQVPKRERHNDRKVHDHDHDHDHRR
jgi:predicted small secreted protein